MRGDNQLVALSLHGPRNGRRPSFRGGEEDRDRMPYENFDRGTFRLLGIRKFIDKKTIGFFAGDRSFGYPDDPRHIIDLRSERNRRWRGDHIIGRFQPLLSVRLRPTEDSD